jgi:hypothetical protein
MKEKENPLLEGKGIFQHSPMLEDAVYLPGELSSLQGGV